MCHFIHLDLMILFLCFVLTSSDKTQKRNLILQFHQILHHVFWLQRITIPEIRNHEWFLKNLPVDLMDENTKNNQFQEPDQPMQSMEEIMRIISEATIPAAGTNNLNQYLTGSLDIDDDMDEDLESDQNLTLTAVAK